MSAPLKPHALLVDPDGIPRALTDLPQWVLWRYAPNDKRDNWTKTPLQARYALKNPPLARNASSTKSKTWATFSDAYKAHQLHPPVGGDIAIPDEAAGDPIGHDGSDGIGLVLTPNNGITGIDLDHCLDAEGNPVAWAVPVLERFADTYMEVSPSGTGLRIFALGGKPATTYSKRGDIEVYDGRAANGTQGGRYLTVTGHRYGKNSDIAEKQGAITWLYQEYLEPKGSPKVEPTNTPTGDTSTSLLDDTVLRKKMFSSKKGAEIRRLWDGDTSGYAKETNDGHSEADLALCSHLLWWCNYDFPRADRLFRQSKLMRPKWDSKRGNSTYGAGTLFKAAEGKMAGNGYVDSGVTVTVTDGSTPPLNDEGLEPWPELRELPPKRPPAPSLPSALVPPALRPWIDDATDRLCTWRELVAIPAIIALAACLGRRVAVRPKALDTSWLEPMNLYGVVVAPPSSLKTPAQAEGVSHLQAIAADALRDFNEGAAAREAALEIAKLELAALKGGAGKGKERTAPDPSSLAVAIEKLQSLEAENHPRRYIIGDATTEKIAELLVQNPDGLLNLRDELIGLLKSFDKHGRESDRDFYLEAWNGKQPYNVDRIGRGSFTVEAVCLSVYGNTQPGRFSHYVSEAIDGGAGADGLLQRFNLLAYPDELPPFENVERDRDHSAYDRARRVYRALAAFTPATYNGARSDTDIPSIGFSDDAQALYTGWRVELMQRIRGAALRGNEALQAHLGKYPGFIAKLALLFHLCEYADGHNNGGGISYANTELAVQWAAYLEQHARKVYASGDSLYAARILADDITGGHLEDGATLRSIYKNERAGLDSVEAVKTAVEALASYGWVQIQKSKSGNKGGRPTETLRVHPGLRE